MRPGLLGGLLGVTAALTFGAAEEAFGQVGKNAPGWLNNYEAARAASRQSGKPIFLVFR